jgi:hypothetical protein
VGKRCLVDRRKPPKPIISPPRPCLDPQSVTGMTQGGNSHRHSIRDVLRCAAMVLISLSTPLLFCEWPDARRQATRSKCGLLRVAVQGRHSTLACTSRPATHHAQVTAEGQSATSMPQLPQEKYVFNKLARGRDSRHRPLTIPSQRSSAAAACPAATTAKRRTSPVCTNGPGETAWQR